MTEIALVDPTHIICLGREAMHSVMGIPLTSLVGKERAKGWRTLIIAGKPRKVMVSWHPAYELRATQQGNLSVNHQMAADWRDIAAKLPELQEK
jgi:uracil-DNA glycosylase family 4